MGPPRSMSPAAPLPRSSVSRLLDRPQGPLGTRGTTQASAGWWATQPRTGGHSAPVPGDSPAGREGPARCWAPWSPGWTAGVLGRAPAMTRAVLGAPGTVPAIGVSPGHVAGPQSSERDAYRAEEMPTGGRAAPASANVTAAREGCRIPTGDEARARGRLRLQGHCVVGHGPSPRMSPKRSPGGSLSPRGLFLFFCKPRFKLSFNLEGLSESSSMK